MVRSTSLLIALAMTFLSMACRDSTDTAESGQRKRSRTVEYEPLQTVASHVPESAVADPPKAVENFYKCYGDMQEAMAQFQAASRTPTIEQRLASLKLAEERLASLHELAKTVNANDLDAIYPQWGNRFTSDFLPAIDLLLRCTRTMDSGYANQASVHLAAWDQWLGAHFSKIGSRLNEKYGIETR